MTEKIYKQKGFPMALFAALLIISIALVTEYFKSLFVHETGNISAFGSLGVLLAIGLVLKWKYVREILKFAVSLSLCFMIFILLNSRQEFLLPLAVLTLAICVVLYLITFSKDVRTYCSNK